MVEKKLSQKLRNIYYIACLFANKLLELILAIFEMINM